MVGHLVATADTTQKRRKRKSEIRMLLGRAFFEEEGTGYRKSEQTASKIASKNPQEARHQAQALEEETTHERRSCVRLGTWWRGARAGGRSNTADSGGM